MIIVVDDEDRENEGDLTIAAEKITPEAINFMARHGRGLICLTMTAERLDDSKIPLMVHDNTSRFDTAFCMPIEARRRRPESRPHDRAATVLAAIDPPTGLPISRGPATFFPCARSRRRARPRRADRSRGGSRAHRRPVSGRRHLRNHERRRHDGARAGADEFAKQHGLLMITIADLIKYRMRTETLVKRVAEAKLPTEHGEFRVHAFENQIDRKTHVALVHGDIGDGEDVLVRVHSQCLTGDVFHSVRCDCGAQLDRRWAHRDEGRGVLLYLNQEGRGIGLANKIAPTSYRTRARYRGGQ